MKTQLLYKINACLFAEIILFSLLCPARHDHRTNLRQPENNHHRCLLPPAGWSGWVHQNKFSHIKITPELLFFCQQQQQQQQQLMNSLLWAPQDKISSCWLMLFSRMVVGGKTLLKCASFYQLAGFNFPPWFRLQLRSETDGDDMPDSSVLCEVSRRTVGFSQSILKFLPQN